MKDINSCICVMLILMFTFRHSRLKRYILIKCERCLAEYDALWGHSVRRIHQHAGWGQRLRHDISNEELWSRQRNSVTMRWLKPTQRPAAGFRCNICTCRVGWLWDTVAGPWALTMTGTWKRLLERAAAALATLKASDRESQDFLLKMEFTSWMTWSCGTKHIFHQIQREKHTQRKAKTWNNTWQTEILPPSEGAPCPHGLTGNKQQSQTWQSPQGPLQTGGRSHQDHPNELSDPERKEEFVNTSLPLSQRTVTQHHLVEVKDLTSISSRILSSSALWDRRAAVCRAEVMLSKENTHFL